MIKVCSWDEPGIYLQSCSKETFRYREKLDEWCFIFVTNVFIQNLFIFQERRTSRVIWTWPMDQNLVLCVATPPLATTIAVWPAKVAR